MNQYFSIYKHVISHEHLMKFTEHMLHEHIEILKEIKYQINYDGFCSISSPYIFQCPFYYCTSRTLPLHKGRCGGLRIYPQSHSGV